MRFRTTAIGLLWGLLGAVAAPSQETGFALEFSLSNPGARSMGLGGAFVALADDATAAYANPAGLVQLRRPEVSVEGRTWSFSTPYVEGGRLDGEPTGLGLDTISGLREAESSEQTSGLSFVSFVFPHKKWAVAFYRHSSANFEFAGETQGFFSGERQCGLSICPNRLEDQRWFSEMEITGYGLTGAYRLTESFSVGLGLVYYDAFMLQTGETFLVDDPDSIDDLSGRNSYRLARRTFLEIFSFDDSDWGLNAGLLWSPSSRWRVGLAYRQGPELAIDAEAWLGQAADWPGFEPGSLLGRATLSPAQFPDVYSLGLSWKAPGDHLTLGLEWDRVEYSSLFDSGPTAEVFAVDDADEPHLGGEYVFLRTQPVVALRAGIWRDPDHRIRSLEDDPLVLAIRRPGDDVTHYSIGLGFAFRSFQLDAGVDLSATVDTASLSGVFSF